MKWKEMVYMNANGVNTYDGNKVAENELKNIPDQIKMITEHNSFIRKDEDIAYNARFIDKLYEGEWQNGNSGRVRWQNELKWQREWQNGLKWQGE